MLASCAGAPPVNQIVKLEGTGAFFPLPLYSKWFKAYGATHPNVKITYEGVGSGGGIKAFVDHTADFGASDAAVTDDDLERVDPSLGAQLVPMTAGCVVLIYNLPEGPRLKLSRKAYSGIFLGKITRWNDPVIAKDNAGYKLPALPIELVVRSDASGIALALTKHLDALDATVSDRIGISKTPDWIVGIRATGSNGIVEMVKSKPGAIGYVGFSSAKGKNLNIALLENRSGNFIDAGTASGQSALNSVAMPEDLLAWLPDPTANDAYPIVTYSWLLCYKKYESKKRAALVDFLEYGLGAGQESAEALGYIPMPAPVVQKVRAAVQTISAIS